VRISYHALLSEINREPAFGEEFGLPSQLFSCDVATELALAIVADSNENPRVDSRPARSGSSPRTSRHN